VTQPRAFLVGNSSREAMLTFSFPLRAGERGKRKTRPPVLHFRSAKRLKPSTFTRPKEGIFINLSGAIGNLAYRKSK